MALGHMRTLVDFGRMSALLPIHSKSALASLLRAKRRRRGILDSLIEVGAQTIPSSFATLPPATSS